MNKKYEIRCNGDILWTGVSSSSKEDALARFSQILKLYLTDESVYIGQIYDKYAQESGYYVTGARIMTTQNKACFEECCRETTNYDIILYHAKEEKK